MELPRFDLQAVYLKFHINSLFQDNSLLFSEQSKHAGIYFFNMSVYFFLQIDRTVLAGLSLIDS